MSERDDLDQALKPVSTIEPAPVSADDAPRRDMTEKAFKRYEGLIHRALTSGSFLIDPQMEPGFELKPTTFRERFRDACLAWLKYRYASIIPETDGMREKVRNLRASLQVSGKVRIYDKSHEVKNQMNRNLTVFSAFDEKKIRAALDALFDKRCDMVTVMMPDDAVDARVQCAEHIQSLATQWYSVEVPEPMLGPDAKKLMSPFKADSVSDLRSLIFSWRPLHELPAELAERGADASVQSWDDVDIPIK